MGRELSKRSEQDTTNIAQIQTEEKGMNYTRLNKSQMMDRIVKLEALLESGLAIAKAYSEIERPPRN